MTTQRVRARILILWQGAMSLVGALIVALLFAIGILVLGSVVALTVRLLADGVAGTVRLVLSIAG